MKHFYMILLFLLVSCSDDSPMKKPIDNSIDKFTIFDVGNKNNSSDISITFSLSTVDQLEEIRVVFVPVAFLSSFDLSVAEALTISNYQTIKIAGTSYTINISGGLNDSEGDEIINGKNYVVHLLLIGNDEIVIGDQTLEFTLTNKSLLPGNYVGTWSDNIGSVAISAKLELKDSILSGPLFLTSNFTPGFGVQSGDNGKIRMDISGNTITNYQYNEFLINYLGQTYANGCTGLFTGSGTINESSGVQLRIQFEGSNCAQSLVGTITLRKQ